MWPMTTKDALILWNSLTTRIGYSHSKMTTDERMQRESSLIATIRTNLPDFARACSNDTELVLLHQDSLATDYQEDEFRLLGMAIKYAGLPGKEVRVIGQNRSPLAKWRESSEQLSVMSESAGHPKLVKTASPAAAKSRSA